MNRKKILIAKLGLDGHDRGARIVCRFLRDAGMEVIYSGRRQTPEMVVNAAIEEDVDFIGISILSGAHCELIPLLMDILKQSGMDVSVVVGGIIPKNDFDLLYSSGIKTIFSPGTPLETIKETLERD